MNGLRRVSVVAILVLSVLAAPSLALAHPLGNFTVNTSARIVVRTNEVVLDYVVDMAEIPAFQEDGRIDGDGNGHVSNEEEIAYRGETCEGIVGAVSLTVDGRPARLLLSSSSLAFPAGQAGLRTLRLTCVASAPIADGSTHEITFQDANFAGRAGWHEVIASGDGATIIRADVPAQSPSDRLRSYPVGAPSDVRTASVVFRPGGTRLEAEPTDGMPERTDGDLLADLASRTELSVGLIALMIVVAIGVGAVHALGPGHGKALIGAYLVGSGGTLRQAVAVGAAVSVMHTASVLVLGLLILSAERLLAPESVYPWLGLGSGVVALGLGSALLVSRIHALAERRRHGHDHARPERPLSRRGLIALAFSGGILPSPSALVVLLASVSLGRVALGLAMIAAFSIGLALSLVAIGALAIRAGAFASGRLPARMMRLAPVASAACIALVGMALTARGLVAL